MFATFKVLAAMGRLGVFTVQELSSAAGVPVSTARTVLNRNMDLCRSGGLLPPGKPGGQFVRYALRDAKARTRLAEKLDGVYSDVLTIRSAGVKALSVLSDEDRETASKEVLPLPDRPPMLSLASLESVLDRLEM